MEFEVVSEVPEAAGSTRKSQWDAVLEAVPDEGAVKIALETDKQAVNKMTALRNYLKRRDLLEKYSYTRQGASLFISKASWVRR